MPFYTVTRNCAHCKTDFVAKVGIAKYCSTACILQDRVIPGNDDCLIWNGATYPKGHGAIRHEGRTLRAHRVAWELAHGPIPDGLHVCHRCDIPGCVNVDHLFLGTNADNIADRVAKGRSPRGEWHPRAKLSREQVVAIKRRIARGEGAAAIARDMGLKRLTVQAIKNGENWAWLKVA